MAKPGRRKGSSKFQFRRPTPRDIWKRRKELKALGLIVTREVTRSLRTSDPHEAKRLQAELSAEWDARWQLWRETLEKGPRTLDEMQQWAVVTAITERLLEEYQKRCGARFNWKHAGRAERWKQLLGVTERLAGATGALIDRELEAQRLVVTPAVRTAIHYKLVGYDPEAAKAALKAHRGPGLPSVEWPDDGDLERAANALHARQTTGDFGRPAFLSRRPGLHVLSGLSQPRSRFTFDDLFETWETWGRGPDERRSVDTHQRYKRELTKLASHLGHDDPAMVTLDDAAEYLRHISRKGPDGKVPAQKNLHNRISILATLFAAGVGAEKLSTNPFKSIIPAKTIRGAMPPRRAFTEDEARMILRAARQQGDSWLRWGPWLMAYSGMRVTEAGQLRKIDIERDGNAAFIHIRVAAGHVKNGTDRLVPVHPALVAEGFLSFVASVTSERLFPQACLDRNGNRFRPKDGRPNDRKSHALGRWVRKAVGIVDKAVDPDHAWRHRFREVALDAGMDVLVTDFLVAHNDGHIRNTYLTSEKRGLLVREMSKFPSLSL